MKKMMVFVLCTIMTVSLLTGCVGKPQQSGSGSAGNGGGSGAESGLDGGGSLGTGKLNYSNMADQDIRDRLADRMTAAGIRQEYADDFFAMVVDYNGLMGDLSEFHDGFTSVDAAAVEYAEDTYTLWMDQRNYADANCRITAFMLMQGLITTGASQDADSFLAADTDALDNYAPCKFSAEQRGRFAALFNPVSVEPTLDSQAVLSALQDQWKTRGISFDEGPVSLVSVLMHSELDNIGYIGHTGVMIEDSQGVLFIEKLTPTSPYQALSFSSKEEVRDYLLNNYGTYYTEGVSAKPVILLNDQAFQ